MVRALLLLALLGARSVFAVCDHSVVTHLSTYLGFDEPTRLQCDWDVPTLSYMNQVDQELFQRDVNIKAPRFNAACDGSTDDAAAITAAVAAAITTGGCVYVPPTANGCAVGSAINLPRNACIRGVGDRSKLIALTNDQTVLRVDGSAVIVRDLFITKGASVTGVTGIWVNPDHDVQANYGHFENVRIEGLSASDLLSAGVVVQGGYTLSCAGEDSCTAASCAGGGDCGAWYSNFEGLRVRFATDGVQLTGTASHLGNGANATRFYALRVGDSTTGLRITRADTALVQAAAFEGITNTAIVISDSGGADNNNNTFFGLRFEANTLDLNVGVNSFFNAFYFAQPTTAKIVDNGTGTLFLSATSLTKLPWGTYTDATAQLTLSPVNGTVFSTGVQFDSTVRDTAASSNDIVLGGAAPSSAQCSGGGCYVSMWAPNSNFGPALTLFGDSVGTGRTFATRTRDFNATTNTGSGCSWADPGNAPTLSCTKNGVQNYTPLIVPGNFEFTEQATPGTSPSAGEQWCYSKAGAGYCCKDTSGVEYCPTGTSSGGSGSSASTSSATTTDATQTRLHNYTTTADTAYNVTATVSARCTSGAGCTAGQGLGCTATGTFKNVSGVVSQVGTTSYPQCNADITGLTCTTACALAAATAGGCTADTDLCVLVTGGSSATIAWRDTLTLQTN